MSASVPCAICERIFQIKKRTNPYAVTKLSTGYVVLGDFQFYRGYTLFFYKEHRAELHELDHKTKLLFLEEMSMVAGAVFDCFKPLRLNYELLGNADHHLHWHIFPRHNDDPLPAEPIWVLPKAIRCAAESRPTLRRLDELKQCLLTYCKNAKGFKLGHTARGISFTVALDS